MPRASHRSRVDTLSDEDSVPGSDVVFSGREKVLPQEECTIAAQLVLASLRRPYSCSAAKRRRGRDHRVVACCLHAFQKPGLLQRLIDQRLQWQQLHKLDQGRLLFDILRLLFHEQGVARYYTVLGQPVCRGGFMLLWGVGSTRFRAIYNTVAEGHPSPPVDLRYLKKVQSRNAHVLSWTTSFLEELYESVAETLPDSLNDVDCEWWEDVLGETPFYDPGQVAGLDLPDPPHQVAAELPDDEFVNNARGTTCVGRLASKSQLVGPRSPPGSPEV